jgi:dienelactone hydrolase
MRRLLLVIAAVALLTPTAAGAATLPPKPPTTVVAGAAHKVGGRVVGWFVVKGAGKKLSRRGKAYVNVGNAKGAEFIGWYTVPPLRPGERRRWKVSARLPGNLAAGEWRINACMNRACIRLGHFTLPGQTAGGSPPTGPPAGTGPPVPAPTSTVPTDPIPYIAGQPFEVTSGAVPYWAFVPDSYDPSNLTPAPLLIWLHGCGGESSGDIWVVDPGAEGEPQDWLTIAVGGREGECWTPSVDEAKVMAALADVETHFDVDRRRVILGGYSSGGDLAYRTGFRHSSTFAGLLIENSSPFRDTESSAAESLAAATTRPHIVHLAHLGDTTYPLAGVQQEVGEVAAAGFPIELIERPGTHSDANTDSDLRELLLPHIDDGWLA